MTKSGHIPCQAEHQARALADQIIARGGCNGASDDDRTHAETATIILEIAEKKAGLVDRSAYEAILADIQVWEETAEASIRDMAARGASQAEIDEAVQRIVAETDTKQHGVTAWLDRQGERAWMEAARDLQDILDGGLRLN